LDPLGNFLYYALLITEDGLGDILELRPQLLLADLDDLAELLRTNSKSVLMRAAATASLGQGCSPCRNFRRLAWNKLVTRILTARPSFGWHPEKTPVEEIEATY
jgi:hypothetical protein